MTFRSLGTIFALAASTLLVGSSQPSDVNCPVSWFCVSNYVNVQAALNAASSAGSGVVFFSQSVLLAAAKTIPANVTIECQNQGVVLATSSATADLFDAPNNNFMIKDCGLAYLGNAMKRSGSLLNMSGTVGIAHDLHIGAGCYYCISLNGLIDTVADVTFDGNISTAPAPTSGLIAINDQVTHLSNITGGASALGNQYSFGVLVQSGAVDGVNLDLINDGNALWEAPPVGQSVFVKISNSYLDNCENSCALIQPSGGTIGYTEFNSVEFGVNSPVGVAVDIDQASGGGNIGQVRITNSNVFNYASGGNCISLLGSLGDIIIIGNVAGSGCEVGFATNPGVTGGLTVMGNSLFGSMYSIFLSDLLPQSLIALNRLNGGGAVTGGNSSPNYQGNLP